MSQFAADSLGLFCLGPGAAQGLTVRPFPRRAPRAGEVEVEVCAAAVNPIDVRRAGGYGKRLLGLIGAARFPLVLGNDFSGHVTAVGKGVRDLEVGTPVFGLKPPSAAGTHARHVLVRASHTLPAPRRHGLETLAVQPYSFVTSWRALADAGLTPANARGKEVLVHGAAGGLGVLAVQLLSDWGARATAICSRGRAETCLAAGAVECTEDLAHATRERRFDATLNFAAWKDEAVLLRGLRAGALGHATTVHPLMGHLDRLGWLRGALAIRAEKRRHAALLPTGNARYAWTLFRPDTSALSQLTNHLTYHSTCLQVGCAVPFGRAEEAFAHVTQGKTGRAVLRPRE